MSTIVFNSRLPSADTSRVLKGILDDFEAEAEKNREAEDIKTLAAAGSDPEKLRTAMGSLRSKRGKAVAMGELSNLPTELEKAHAELYRAMPGIYQGRIEAPDERRQAALDQKRLTATVLQKAGGDFAKSLDTKWPGWAKGPLRNASQVQAAYDKLKEAYGYDAMGETEKQQFDANAKMVLENLNKGTGAFRIQGQFEVPESLSGQAPEATPTSKTFTPAEIRDFPQLVPLIPRMTEEEIQLVRDAIDQGKSKQSILDALYKDKGIR